MNRRVCVVTAGHLSTCPRMLKAADALAGAGYRVRVVSTQSVDWATAIDADVRRRRPDAWDWSVVKLHRGPGATTYLWTGMRFKMVRSLARFVGPHRLPGFLVARALSRVHAELVRASLAEPTDLFYGGTVGALAAVAAAGRRAGTPYALDLEDFHSDEQDAGRAARLAHGLVERIERRVLPGAVYLTAGSGAIAAAYARMYGVNVTAVHNTFPLPEQPPRLAPSSGDGLKLYWFSQTIGPGRGLEDAVRAAGLRNIRGELHLRGRAIPGYLDSLRRLAGQSAERLRITHHEPAAPDAMAELCAGYDVGLSLEQGHVLNRALCLTNKAFTYMLGGLAIAFSDTPGQRPLALDLGEGALLYAPGDVESLAAGLKRWSDDKSLLVRAKAAAWEAARRRWHWEHPSERGALLEAVARVLAR
jgi:hypothetical protein